MEPEPMDLSRLEIDPDIARARALPGAAYASAAFHALAVERAFAPSWQYCGDVAAVRRPGSAVPLTLLPGSLDEPLVLTRDLDDRAWCLSNVCTHRGNLLVEGCTALRELRCRYHGRRFELNGSLKSAPGFEGAAEFPSAADDLDARELAAFGPLLFTAPRGTAPLETSLAPLAERVAHLPLDRAAFDAARSRDYFVRANWALYCDNYLEGFHIPYVHAGLAAAVDVGSYSILTFDAGVLQIARAADGEPAFDLPAGHPDSGGRIAAYYWWLFPNTMINVYPWGVSLNVVCPRGVDATRVAFRSYVLDPELLDRGAGGSLDRVEREDEAVVEACQAGVASRHYGRGRYAPRHEPGVHHFHRLLVAAVRGE